MTCCLAISLPNCSIAAADTRVGIKHDSGQLNHDGPNDFSIQIESLNRTIELPFSYRKIRSVADGWVVCAGEHTSGTEILDLLKRKHAILFSQAKSAITGDASLIERAALATGILPTQLRETLFIGAPFGSSAHAWTIGLRPSDDRTNRSIARAINWPLAVPLDEQKRADIELSKILSISVSHTSSFTYAKALASIIDTAAQYAPDVGPLIQIGMTLIINGIKRSIYFEGVTMDLLAMTEKQFENSIQYLK